jgi:hypothetical protein
VDSKTFPSSQFPENSKELKGFSWRGEERLTSKADLLKGRERPVLPKIKGIKDPEIYEDFFEGIDELNSNSNLKNSTLKNIKENTPPKALEKSPKPKTIKPIDEE